MCHKKHEKSKICIYVEKIINLLEKKWNVISQIFGLINGWTDLIINLTKILNFN
jgi:hypothetical protein